MERPQDPIAAILDLQNPLTDEEAEIAFQLFLSAAGFIILFDGSIYVCYTGEGEEDEQLHERVAQGPWTFGGLQVKVCRDLTQPLTGRGTEGTGAGPSHPLKNPTGDDIIVLKDGERVYFRPPLYGKEMPQPGSIKITGMSVPDLAYLHFPVGSWSGRLLKGPDGTADLTTATHSLTVSRQSMKDVVRRGKFFFPRVKISKNIGREVFREGDDLPVSQQ